MQFVVGHSIRTPSEEQGKNGYLGRQLDVTDSESFSQSHSNDASSPIPRLTSDQPQGREGVQNGESLDLELGKDREFTFKCDSSVWVETQLLLGM